MQWLRPREAGSLAQGHTLQLNRQGAQSQPSDSEPQPAALASGHLSGGLGFTDLSLDVKKRKTTVAAAGETEVRLWVPPPPHILRTLGQAASPRRDPISACEVWQPCTKAAVPVN